MAFGAELTLQGFFRSRSDPHVPSSNILHLKWKHYRRVFRRTHNLILPPADDEPLGPSCFSQFGFCLPVLSEFRRQLWIRLEGLDFPPSACNFLYHKITSFAIEFAMDRPTRICPSIVIVADINFVHRLYVDYTPRPLEFIQRRQLAETLILETLTEGLEVESNVVVDETFILGGTTQEWGGTEIDSHTFFEAFVLGISEEVHDPFLEETFNPGTSTEGLGDADVENNSRIEMLKRGRRGKWVMGGGDETTCSVCMEGFSEGVEVMTMECEHIFHEECILTWLKQKQTCPLCRRQILSTSAFLPPPSVKARLHRQTYRLDIFL